MRKTTIIPALMVLFILFSSSYSYASFTDIEGNWARDPISHLDEMGVFEGVWEERFLPNESVSREAVIEIAGRAFGLDEAGKQSLYTWIDHFLPMSEEAQYQDDLLTRGELAGLVGNLLGLSDNIIVPNDWYPSFEDLDKDHPAFLYVEVLNKLGILPTYVINRFEPDRLATRAEAAFMIDSAVQLDAVEGVITEVLGSSNRIVVKTSNDEFRSLPLSDQTVIYRNGQIVTNEQLKAGDPVYALYDAQGQVRLVSLSGADSSPALLQSVTNLTQILADILTPQQIAAIINGDWQKLNDEVRYELYQEIVDRGVAPWEAEALLSQDWTSLQDMVKDRLAAQAADYLSITPEMIYAAINRDWQKVLEYAQVELAERLLSSSWLKDATRNP
ncbi:MAG: S-layer homology domain-containing protein [Firmicutes bacterium]|nr:S-layer homology domain-containing protein [Bacillota bacterium]